MSEKEKRSTEFAIFCIENTASRLNKSGLEVYLALKSCDGIEKFILPSFPMLHTQGKNYIVDEVLQYLQEHNPSFLKGGLS